jgi:hypothetical protein
MGILLNLHNIPPLCLGLYIIGGARFCCEILASLREINSISKKLKTMLHDILMRVLFRRLSSHHGNSTFDGLLIFKVRTTRKHLNNPP